MEGSCDVKEVASDAQVGHGAPAGSPLHRCELLSTWQECVCACVDRNVLHVELFMKCKSVEHYKSKEVGVLCACLNILHTEPF